MNIAGWSSPVARQAHNLKVTGSNPVPATNSLFPDKENRTRSHPPREESGSSIFRGGDYHGYKIKSGEYSIYSPHNLHEI